VEKVGEGFDGVITGVANFGLFVQMPRFNVEGLVRMQDLGDDWWDVDPKTGTIRGQRSGRAMRIGDVLAVRIAGVDVARRQLNLVLNGKDGKSDVRKKDGGKKDGGKKQAGKKPSPAKTARKVAKASAKSTNKGPRKQRGRRKR